MANKKGNNKNSKTNSKKVSKTNRKDNFTKINSVGEFNADYKKIIITISIIMIVFVSFYALTVYITGRDNKSESSNTNKESTFSYTDAIVGRSFGMPEKEYVILYYDYSDSDLEESFSSLITNYRADNNHYALYCVDMSSDINKAYISENSNTSPNSVSDLAISGPTLIHFKDGSVVEYLEGVDSITSFLE